MLLFNKLPQHMFQLCPESREKNKTTVTEQYSWNLGRSKGFSINEVYLAHRSKRSSYESPSDQNLTGI